ncbi:MAG: glycosyltransferase [Phycisphaerales bacterium]|nr:glycosyltransferase [Phycisphaerales bacterium]
MPDPISVLLPIHRWNAHADDAIASILQQTHTDLELLIIVNGPDTETRRRSAAYELADRRVRVIHHPRASLPEALNVGMRNASHDLIARMDSDDWSHPDRLAVQAAYMKSHPELAACAVGTRIVGADDQEVSVHQPPSTASEARWKILIWNPFIHGAMMFRKKTVQGVGGYDESLERAQDYDLWIRLADSGIGGLHQVLYTHRVRASDSKPGLDHLQAQHTSKILLSAWAKLCDAEGTEIEQIESIIARIAAGNESARSQLEHHMQSHGPSRQSLMAWMWSCWRYPIAATAHDDRQARIERGRVVLESKGIKRIFLWGAGDFARRIIAETDALGVQIIGIVDDFRAGSTLGEFTVVHPDTMPDSLASNEAVVIASDLYEQAIWDRSQQVRERGVQVIRLSLQADRSPEAVR